MDSQILARKLKRQVKHIQEIPGLIVKLKAEGLFPQLEKAFTYAYETCENPDEEFKEHFKIIIDQIIDLIYDDPIARALNSSRTEHH